MHVSLLSSPQSPSVFLHDPPAGPLSSPLLPGKGEAGGESLTDLVFKATVVAACDFLIGQAVGTSRGGPVLP